MKMYHWSYPFLLIAASAEIFDAQVPIYVKRSVYILFLINVDLKVIGYVWLCVIVFAADLRFLLTCFPKNCSYSKLSTGICLFLL